MKGLIWKDLYVMKSMGRSYLAMFGVFGVMSLMGIYDGLSFVSFLVVMMLIMMPINTFAYDEQAKWDNFAVASPAGKKGVVGGKYLFTALLLVLALALCCGLQAGMYFFNVHGTDTLPEMLGAAVVTVSGGAVLDAILLPLIFKFGTQKSRIFLMITVGLGVAGAVILLGIVAGSEVDLGRMAVTTIGLGPIVAVGMMVISYFISLGIYEKKEL